MDGARNAAARAATEAALKPLHCDGRRSSLRKSWLAIPTVTTPTTPFNSKNSGRCRPHYTLCRCAAKELPPNPLPPSSPTPVSSPPSPPPMPPPPRSLSAPLSPTLHYQRHPFDPCVSDLLAPSPQPSHLHFTAPSTDTLSRLGQALQYLNASV